MKLEDIDFRLRTSVAGHKEHSLLYRDDRVGVQMEIHTPVKTGGFGKARRIFSIDKDDRTFENIEDFKKAIESITIPDVETPPPYPGQADIHETGYRMKSSTGEIPDEKETK